MTLLILCRAQLRKDFFTVGRCKECLIGQDIKQLKQNPSLAWDFVLTKLSIFS